MRPQLRELIATDGKVFSPAIYGSLRKAEEALAAHQQTLTGVVTEITPRKPAETATNSEGG